MNHGNLQGRVPLEPLDEERLTNIERKLVIAVSDMRAPEERAPRRLIAFASVALALTIAGFVGWKLRGGGAIVAPGAVETFAVNTDRGHTVQLGDETLGAIALTSGAATDLRVERARGRVIVYMQRGAIDLNIEHKPGRLVVVRAGDTEIEDVGTRFTVDYDGKDRLEVRVTEGEVKVKRGGKHEDIKAGFAWTKATGTLAIAELDAQSATTVVAMADPVSATAGTTQATASGGATATSSTSSPTTGSATGSTTTQTSGAAQGSGAAQASGAGGPKKVYTANPRKALLGAKLDPPENVGTTDAKVAKAKYLDMIKHMAEGEDKARLLYSMAYVQHMAKNNNEAEHLLTGVLRRNAGPAYRSALWLDVRIKCLRAFDDRCRRAAEMYRNKFPDGMHTGIADQIVVAISRAR